MLFSQNALICWPHIWNTLYPFWSMLNVSINQESVTINLKLFPIPLDFFCFFWRLILFKITSTQDDSWSSLWYLLGLNKYAKNKTYFFKEVFHGDQSLWKWLQSYIKHARKHFFSSVLEYMTSYKFSLKINY